MAEYSGFFNAKFVNGKYDREYNAEDFARYFASFIGNGVFEDNLNSLLVSEKEVPDMGIRVLSGMAFMNGYKYENDDDFFLTINVANGILNRIDAVVLRWEAADRSIHLSIKEGVASGTAIAPTLQRDADVYEFKLAEVYVRAGATNISQSDIIDTRSDKEVCGFVRTIPDKELQKLISGFEEVKEVNDEIRKDVTSLQSNLSVESEEYPGCFYRVASNGEIEWINAPMMNGIEYRTNERYNNQPVYIKKLYVAKMTNNAVMTINIGAPGNKVISIEGYMYDVENMTMNLFPHVKTNIVNVSAALGSVNNNGRLTIYTSANLTTFECYVTAKYIK